jgi:hypothetical protein
MRIASGWDNERSLTAMVKYREELEARVVRAAEAALGRQQYVSAIDVLCGMALLQPTHVDQWRKGRIDCLEQMIQGNPDKISFSIQTFHRWAQQKSLKPSETAYLRGTRAGTMPLQFPRSRDPEIEKRYRIHYLSPAMPERKQQQLQEKLDRPPEPVVFQIVRDSECSECGTNLDKGSFLLMEAEQPAGTAATRSADARGAWVAEVRFGFPQRDGQPAPGSANKSGRMLVAQLGPDDFLLTGIGGSVFFHRPGFLPGIRMQILTAEEGYYTPADKPGAPEVWHVKRVLNGDETDRGIRFPDPSANQPASGDPPPPAPAHAGPMAVRIVLGRF